MNKKSSPKTFYHKILKVENLRNRISNYNKLSEADIEFALQFYKRKELVKNEILIQPGQFVKNWYYVDKGCLCFYTLKDGNEKVLEFFTENDFFTDLYSYLKEKPSNVYFRATEPTVLNYILKDDVQKSFDHSHQIERMGRLMMQDTFIQTFQRVAHLNYLSNEERYLRLIQKRPDLLQRVPQYMIASYLGLTPVGLSKIRKRLSLSS